MLSGKIISLHSGNIWQVNAAHADLRTAEPTIPFDPLKYDAQTTTSLEKRDAQALYPCALTTCRRNLVQVLQNFNSNKTNQTKPITQIHVYTLNVRGLYKSRLDIQQALYCHKPDILVLTETKLNNLRRRPWLNDVLKKYETERVGLPPVQLGAPCYLGYQSDHIPI